MSPTPVAVVIDPGDDAVHTHTALAAHHPPSGRITLHPGPGTTSETGLAHDLLAALGKPPLLPGRFPAGRQPAWEAATAWITALPVTRLTVLRAHRLTARRTMRLLQLRALTGIRLTLVCHRPHLPAALHQALRTADYAVTTDFQAARRHYYGATAPVPPPAEEPARSPDRWLTLSVLDRLVSYDSPIPCTAPCTPPPITFRHRPPPAPLTGQTTREVTRRLSTVTAHPRLATALAAALFTGASFQQLATARPGDYDDAAATLALHDRARYTDGCATHRVPPWARVFLKAAVCFARLAPGQDQHLLAGPHDRTHLLLVAEAARMRPPQPPVGQRTGPVGRIQWDWRERKEAQYYDAMLTRHQTPPSP
ncbi:hypothetical protein [Streptomyces europaeiscabiei]|uniref:hypothetical protein n=1 Tax=Streptomyces europaeiscabiei TaxID=146819 RepID=UPI002E255CEF|nr:hypothetical protein OG858_00070 [Streptomyces europaeiscabiei]WUD38170.1 hypothetical protein OG858_46815 [Streptomyces europaeiscabiei]